eukprot:GEZU01005838.1.p1 GENE.GEZU01005838.1~~GEZU01005838.1.p1  ORF type:complete len:138 (+),score=27.14 GEZU01005838.1:56-415(+)
MDMVQGHLMLNDNPYEHTRREFFAKQDQSLAVATHGNNPSSCSSNNNAAASITHRRYAAAEADEDGLVTRLIQKSDYYKGERAYTGLHSFVRRSIHSIDRSHPPPSLLRSHLFKQQRQQ